MVQDDRATDMDACIFALHDHKNRHKNEGRKVKLQGVTIDRRSSCIIVSISYILSARTHR